MQWGAPNAKQKGKNSEIHISCYLKVKTMQKGRMTMKTNYFNCFAFVSVILFGLMILFPSEASSHCDTMNGPVVKAAVKALESGNVNFVLVWVQKKDEAEIKKAFAKALSIRKLSSEAKEFADYYFFETLVRIHRAGEGASYTGLKTAESEAEPGIVAADNAIEKGSVDELMKSLTETIYHGVHEQFSRVLATKNYRPDDVEAGREYVKTYVMFIHYVERLYQSALSPAEGHYHEADTHDEH